MALIVLSLVLLLLVLIYKYAMSCFDVFQQRGIVHDAPKPFIGNLSWQVMYGSASFLEKLFERHQRYKQHKIYGFYNMRSPFFVLSDLELIKRVGIQHFDHFTNHPPLIPEASDALFTKSLTALKDEKWREMRNTLTPSFTGSKIKAMFELINECSVAGINYLATELQRTAQPEIELEMKNFFERFANDVIASTAFGIKVNSFVDIANQFYKTGKSMTKFSNLAMLKLMLYGIMPRIMKAFKVKLFDIEGVEYFRRLVFDAMKYRTEHNIIRPDMIQLLMDARRVYQTNADNSAQHAEFNDDDLFAQCLLFFFVGFETMSTCLCFLSYELCLNQQVQAQLYEEIQSVEQALQGAPLNYNVLMKMKYLDMVVSELLRLWPPAFSISRVCNKDIDMRDENNQLLVQFKKDDIIIIPVIAIQRDAAHFANPELFQPERFAEENRDNIQPYTYLPFGIGPRSCIANRMALMEVKSIIYHFLVAVLCALLYKWSVAKYDTFNKRGVPHEPPTPLLGNVKLKALLGMISHMKLNLEQYATMKSHKVFGSYFLREPVYLITDLDLIKQVGVKHFDHFMNHKASEEIETPMSKSLISLQDARWREMRNILSPSFTGIKMRAMYVLINGCSHLSVEYIEQQLKQQQQSSSIELEMKDYFTRFTNDVIASAAFGIKVNSFEDKENQFYKTGQSVTNMSLYLILKSLLFFWMPRVMKALRVSIWNKKVIDYFKSLVLDAVKYRKEHKIVRPDMIQLLMEAQRNSAEGDKQLTDEELLAQCLLFFFAGFETVSICLCFTTYELCMNPEVQQKLYEEIMEVEQQLQGKALDYDTLVHMKYLHMVISEALRKWPPANATDRKCARDIDLRDENNEIVMSFKKDDQIFIPILPLHYDEEYFPEPLKFMPERFADENKHLVNMNAYLPFGIGPRSCI
ncbi:Cyp9h1, partial [Drosophila busckii]